MSTFPHRKAWTHAPTVRLLKKWCLICHLERHSSSTKAIEYWADKRSAGTQKQQCHALDSLRILIEVLARSVVRAPTTKAKSIFQLAIKLGKNTALHHFWLYPSLNHLIQYSLDSIPKAQQHELLVDALSFPLKLGDDFERREWPNPVIRHPGNREANSALDRQITEIIDQVATCSSQSSATLLRLLPLVEHNFLTTLEKENLAEVIWGNEPDYQVLPDTGLLVHALLALPSANNGAVKERVRKALFEIQDERLFNPTILLSISQMAQMETNKQFPNSEQAVDYFERLTAWRPNNVDGDFSGLTQQEEQRKNKRIGEALAGYPLKLGQIARSRTTTVRLI